MLATTDNTRAERRVQFAFAAAGLVLVALGQYLSKRPSIYEQSEFWTSSPTWFAIRVGILMTAARRPLRDGSRTIALGRHWNRSWRSLERFGRSSLFVYWIHVELVYGYATWPLHGRLRRCGARSSPVRPSAC